MGKDGAGVWGISQVSSYLLCLSLCCLCHCFLKSASPLCDFLLAVLGVLLFYSGFFFFRFGFIVKHFVRCRLLRKALYKYSFTDFMYLLIGAEE